MNPTPDTFNYMVGGYVVFAVVMSAYIASLVSRWRGLQREEKMLGEVEDKS